MKKYLYVVKTQIIKSLTYENIVAFDGAKCIENRLGEEGTSEWR